MNDDIIDEELEIADEQAVALGEAILTKPIRALKLKLPVTVRKETTVRECIRQMVQNKTGVVLIDEDDHLIGIFTERDVLTKVVGRGLDPSETPVDSVMTRAPETLKPEAPLCYALNKMSVGGFRHVPLADDRGRPVGVVGMRDIVDYIVDLFPGDILNLPPEPSLDNTRSREGA
jgi:CBS domain-containing protein